MKMNKRGDLATTLLVIMIIVLFLATSFSFISSSGKVETKIFDSRFLESVYLNESQTRFEINNAGESTFVKAYDEIVVSDALAKLNNGGMTSDELNNLVKDKFSAYWKADSLAKKYNKFETSINGNFVELNIKEFSIFKSEVVKNEKRVWIWGFIPTWYKTTEQTTMKFVYYKPILSFRFESKSLGLERFDDIKNAFGECKNLVGNGEIEKCLGEKLTNLNAKAQEENGKKIFNFETKKAFLIDGQLRKIRFSLSA